MRSFGLLNTGYENSTDEESDNDEIDSQNGNSRGADSQKTNAIINTECDEEFGETHSDHGDNNNNNEEDNQTANDLSEGEKICGKNVTTATDSVTEENENNRRGENCKSTNDAPEFANVKNGDVNTDPISANDLSGTNENDGIQILKEIDRRRGENAQLMDQMQDEEMVKNSIRTDENSNDFDSSEKSSRGDDQSDQSTMDIEILRREFAKRHKRYNDQRAEDKRVKCLKIGEEIFDIIEKIQLAGARSEMNMELIQSKKDGAQGRYDHEKAKLDEILRVSNPTTHHLKVASFQSELVTKAQAHLGVLIKTVDGELEQEILRRSAEIRKIWEDHLPTMSRICKDHNAHWEEKRQQLAESWRVLYQSTRRGECSRNDDGEYVGQEPLNTPLPEDN